MSKKKCDCKRRTKRNCTQPGSASETRTFEAHAEDLRLTWNAVTDVICWPQFRYPGESTARPSLDCLADAVDALLAERERINNNA